MVYLKKASSWPNGGVPAEGSEGRQQVVPGWDAVLPIYQVLGRVANSDPGQVKAAADAFFRGNDVASYVPCGLAELKDGRTVSFPHAGVMVTLRDGTRFLCTTVSDGHVKDGVSIGHTKDVILQDRD